MTDDFEIEIKKLISEGEDLFYNHTGLTEAYKLGVKHISSAASFNYGKILLMTDFKSFNGKQITIVDFDKETIISNEIYVKIIKLQ